MTKAAAGRSERLAMGRHLWLGVCALFVLLAGFGSWVGLASLSGALVAPARLVLSQANSKIQNPDGGVVVEVAVHDGDAVRAGQILVRLDDSSLRSQHALQSKKMDELRARRARLMAERDALAEPEFAPDLLARAQSDAQLARVLRGQRRLFEAALVSFRQEQDILDRQIGQLRRRAEGIALQLRALRSQAALSAAQLEEREALQARRLATVAQVQASRKEAAVLDGRIAANESELAQTNIRISQLQLEHARVASRRRQAAIEQLRDVEFRQDTLAEQLRALKGKIAARTLRAPVAGWVLRPGGLAESTVVAPGETLMEIVPARRDFKIVARLSPLRADKVYPGQPVRVRLVPDGIDARGGGLSGAFDARIARISADVLTDPATGARAFQVFVDLPEDVLRRLSARRDILPGLPARVFISTGSHPVWAYLFAPFTRYFSRALRES